MKHFNLATFGVGALLLFSLASLQATHLVGGNFAWEQLGNSCTYRISFTAYYDCGGAATNPTLPIQGVNILPPVGCQPPVPIGGSGGAWPSASYSEVTPVCPGVSTNCTSPNGAFNGVWEVLYYQDYDFCNVGCTTGNFTLAYSNCCRNGAIVNGGANSGFYIEATMGFDAANGNRAPLFNRPGADYICPSAGGIVDLSATDPDGDSLTYQLVNCMSNTLPITYSPGFSGNIPLGTAWAASFDTQTGLLSLPPNLSASLENYVVCVEISQYNNGNYMGKVLRDMQVTVVACSNSAPVYDSIVSVDGGAQVGPHNVVVCYGDTLDFTVGFSDPDTTHTVCLTSTVAQVMPGATLTPNCVNPVTGRIIWVPDSAANGQTFTFYVTAIDSNCPVPGKTTQVFYVSVGGACLSGVVTNTQCNDSTGAIDITFNGGTPPYTYLWNTGATTEDLSGLPVGKYWVDVSDLNGSMDTDTFYVSATNISLNVTSNPLTCNNPNAAIALNPSGGVAPYTYQWSTGQTSSAIGGLTAGGYSVIITDAVGCLRQEVFILDPPDSCFVSIEGTVFDDLNGNCVQDPGEMGLAYVLVDIAPGWATFTDANGDYYLEADTGNYLLTLMPGAFMTNLCPTGGTISLYFADYNADTTGVDFAMDFLSLQDLRLSMYNGVAVPGITRYNHVSVYNDGSISMNGTVKVKYDPFETFLSSNNPPSLNNPATQDLEWSITQLAPGSSQHFNYYTQVDTAAVLGSLMKTYGSVDPIVGDTTPGNNVDTSCVVVVGSYDPNDKQVEPAGIREPGYILATQNPLEYTVRFQNTGTYPAQYVQIRDTLSGQLNPFSIRPTSSSHPYSLNLEDDSVLVYTFANIQLPDSASDPLGSQGYVRFAIQHNGLLSPGTVIENRAAIYFDFNAPVITNATVNTLFAYPQVGLNPVDSLCIGEELTGMMTAPGMPPYDYAWSNGEQGTQQALGTFGTAVDSAGWYQLTVTDAFGFSTTDSTPVALRPDPLADFSFQVQNLGYTFAFTNLSQFGSSYLWDFGDGTSSSDFAPVHTYQAGDSYTVSLIVTNDCGSADYTTTLTVTDLEDPAFARSVQVIPNPFTDRTEIRFDNPGGQPFRLTLLDMQGKVVRQVNEIREGKIDLEREGLPAGMYLFELSGPKHFIGKLVVR